MYEAMYQKFINSLDDEQVEHKMFNFAKAASETEEGMLKEKLVAIT